MTQYETFPNAPIREAIFDIRVNLPEQTEVATLEGFHEDFKDRFPEKKKKFSWKSPVEIKLEQGPEMGKPEGGIFGYLFKSPKDKKIVQARLDGFTFNKLKPYENWELFRDEGEELWEKYVERTHPINITRLALRYINEIEIPLNEPDVKIEDYLLLGPDTPKEFPYMLSNFLVRLQFHNPDIEANAVVNIFMEPLKGGSILPFIFDIDVYKELVLDPKNPIKWEVMDALRDFKNELFFKGTTEKARELFR